MTTHLQPLLERQRHPFPPTEPVSEEKLQEKGKLVINNLKIIF